MSERGFSHDQDCPVLGRASSHCAGFTMVEMLTVMVLIGIMAAILTKPVSGAFRASARRTAKREASAYLFRARTIAVQQSRASQLVRNGNILKIRVDSSGTMVQLGTATDLGAAYGVTVSLSSSPPDTIKFDPRGFMLTPPTPKIVVTRDAAADTICVTGLGRVTLRSCP